MISLSSEQQCWIERELGIYLPAEIMIKILSKLPAYELLRLIYASEILNSLVQEPLFTESRWKDRPISTGVIFLPEERKEDELRICYPELDGYHYYWIIDIGEEEEVIDMTNSCNGLICVYGKTSVWVLNPSIWEIVELPAATSLPCYQIGHSYYLGLGFIKSTGEYKVVRVYDNGNDHACEIFTLGCSSECWRQVSCIAPPFQLVLNSRSTPVCLNETLYWANWGILEGPEAIISFDLKHEKFDVIHHPVGAGKRHNVLELYGYLCIAYLSISSVIDIWFMEDYQNKTWVKLCSIDLTKMENFSELECSPTRPIGMRDGMIILWNPYGGLEYYDPKSNTFLKGDNLPLGRTATMYVETFVSPISIQGCRNPSEVYNLD